MIFQNILGKITMSDTALTDFMISKYDGLDYISPEFNSEIYVNENGQNTTSKYIPGRMITLQLSIKNYNRIDIENALMVLTRAGTLIIQNDSKVRKIECQCSSFEKGEKNPVIAFRSLQFKCDKVNFEDLYSTKEVLFEKIDMLTSPFTLPMIPTELVSEKDIYNLGYLLIQPIIFITNTAISTGTQPLEYGFEVLNETYDQKIKLNYHTSYGEVIKIDVFNREITSILNGVETSLINYISDDTNLENFFFDLGVNHIKFNNYNVEEVLIAYTEYSNLWIEVV